MLNVGLTGNVAAGKSSVAALFARWGASVIDADDLAREAVAPGSPALAAIVAHFGTDLVLEDGTLDRAALRRRVMSDPALRTALNHLVHPEVRTLRALRVAALERAGARIVVHDIPLLFEVLDPADFDVVVLVDAPDAVRRERLARTRGIAGSEADALLAAQAPSADKRARSSFVIDNDGTEAALESAARAVWTELQARSAAG